MEIVFIGIIVALFLWYYMMLRGRKAVRAFIFLSEMAEEKSEDEANAIASRIDLFAASKFQQQMLGFVNNIYDGSQLTMIAQARIFGFKE